MPPEKIRATTRGIAFLPHPFRFSDASANNPSIVGSASHCNRSSPLHKGAKGDSALPTIPKPHYPSKSTISLPPLSKGGGLTARHKLSLSCVLLATRPPFYSLNFYAVKTEGLLYTHQPLHPHNLLKSTSTALPRTITLASLVKGRWLDGKAQTVALLRFTCNTSAFLFTKLLCRQDGGIALRPPTSPSPQPSQKHIHLSPHTIPSNSSPLNFSLFIIQYSFPPCIPLTTSADNSIIKAVTSISI